MRTFKTLFVPLEVKCWYQCPFVPPVVPHRRLPLLLSGVWSDWWWTRSPTRSSRPSHVSFSTSTRGSWFRARDVASTLWYYTLDVVHFLEHRLKSIVHSSGTRFVWSVLLYTVRDRNNSNSLDQSESEPKSVLKVRIPLLSTIFTLSAFYCAELFLPVVFRSIVFVPGKTSSFFSGFVHDLYL